MFNTYGFIFIFLPIVVVLYYLLAKINYKYSKIEMITASLLFYEFYNIKYIPLILVSILFNYYMSNFMVHSKKYKKYLLIIVLIFNIGTLIYFKYLNFFIENINVIANTNLLLRKVVLPLGISFYTFQQIAYAVDCYKMNQMDISLIDYSFSILFFAKLSQGPIVYYKNIVPQYNNEENYKLNWTNLNKGFLFFTFGLLKKVVIADTLIKYVTPAFDLSTSVTFIEAWGAVLAYTLQLYFDFSGYTDMALGIGYFFNINLPDNFDSPYQSNSIIDFWRTWHITLGNFLKNYVYIPLGGNRKGKIKKDINLFITMLICGIWHGANWNFILWGAIHGLLLIVDHKLKNICIKIPTIIRRLGTFLFVMLGWVVFRAKDFHDALKVYKGIIGVNGISFNHLVYFDKQGLIICTLLFLAVMFVPNIKKIYMKYWKPNYLWLIVTISIYIFCVMSLNKPTEFLYLQF